MIDIIRDKLHELEQDRYIRILYACESGSRAWGFPSPDSDFDVRFIYSRYTDDYLNIHEAKDVIDLPVNDELDIGGWDIKKALKLFLKSNSPLYEWLQSPIIYIDNFNFVEDMRKLMPKYFSLRAGGNHYLSMALNTVANDLQNEEVKIKRYFYALRSAMACKWIIKKQTVPPMELGILRKIEDSKSLQKAIDDLLKIKLVSNEKTLIEHDVVLDKWLNDTLSGCKTSLNQTSSNQQQATELNEIFRKYITL
ncbi:MAG: nucleotidyltransferase domain-containing protein [Mucilaginibacter sp.]